MYTFVISGECKLATGEENSCSIVVASVNIRTSWAEPSRPGHIRVKRMLKEQTTMTTCTHSFVQIYTVHPYLLEQRAVLHIILIFPMGFRQKKGVWSSSLWMLLTPIIRSQSVRLTSRPNAGRHLVWESYSSCGLLQAETRLPVSFELTAQSYKYLPLLVKESTTPDGRTCVQHLHQPCISL